MSKRKLACGTWKLIEDGIERYMRERGRRPAALILHPAHVKEFRREPAADTTLLDGVSVLISPRPELPLLADQNGNPFDL